MSNATEQKTVRIPVDLLAKLEEKANKERRTLTGQILFALDQHVRSEDAQAEA